MTKLQNSITYKRKPEFYEKGVGKSLTIPGESVPVKEILKRSIRGIAPEIIRRAVYVDSQEFDDLDLSKVSTMDLVEIQEISDRTRARIDQLIEDAKKASEEKAQAEHNAQESSEANDVASEGEGVAEKS